MLANISKAAFLLLSLLLVAAGCSQDSAEKIRYDMEKLFYTGQRATERLNVQPELMTSQDSLQFKNAFQAVLDYYYLHRDDSLLSGKDDILAEMAKMAVSAQIQLARYFLGQRQIDSVISAYRKIGREIPADKDDQARAELRLALTYRSLNLPDSTLALYNKVISDYYPPTDSLDRVNTDVISLPIAKINLARNAGDTSREKKYIGEALDYYRRLKNEYPDTKMGRAATIYTSRVFAMNQQWDASVDQLLQLEDSTGQVEVRALMLIADIMNDPKKQVDSAIELYRQVIDRQPDSSIIGTAMLRLGAALCSRGDYEEGRSILAETKKKFELVPRLSAQAQLFYAQAFEKENRWDRALSEYQWLMENHPLTEEAFQAALYIPEHFAVENDDKLAEIWFDRAIQFYEDAAARRPNQAIAIAANMFLADTYVKMEEWEKAIGIYERIYALASRSRTGARALWNAASVTLNELGDSSRAQGYLDRLRADFGSADSSAVIEEESPDLEMENLQ